MQSDGKTLDSDESRFAQAPTVMPPSFLPKQKESNRLNDADNVHSRKERHRSVYRKHSDETGKVMPRSQRILISIVQTATIFAVLLLCVVLVKTFFIQLFFVPSGSMETTVMTGDYVMVNKLADKPDEIHRGDVVVFEDPGAWLNAQEQSSQGAIMQKVTKLGKALGLVPKNNGAYLLKRVIGVGGDHVACCNADGLVKVNGEPIREAYVRDGVNPSDVPFDVTVPEGYLWVMGDNRSNSADSRFHHEQDGSGFVPVSNVEGRAWLIYYPFTHAGLIDSGADAFHNVPDSDTRENKDSNSSSGDASAGDGAQNE